MTLREQMARAMYAVSIAHVRKEWPAKTPEEEAALRKAEDWDLQDGRVKGLWLDMVDAGLGNLAVVQHAFLDISRAGLPLDSGTAARFWITAVQAIIKGAA